MYINDLGIDNLEMHYFLMFRCFQFVSFTFKIVKFPICPNLTNLNLQKIQFTPVKSRYSYFFFRFLGKLHVA